MNLTQNQEVPKYVSGSVSKNSEQKINVIKRCKSFQDMKNEDATLDTAIGISEAD